MSFARFHPAVQQWFTTELGEPTTAQLRGWESIGEGRHTLIAAPTGSGKTLAAFLTALDDLTQEGLRGPLPDVVRVLYISPLKALSADIHKNLAEPRRGIRRIAEATGRGSPRPSGQGTRPSPNARRCCGHRHTSWLRRRSRCTCCSHPNAAVRCCGP